MTDSINKNNEKGATMEEKLAEYFRKLGYFVVRGVKFEFNNHLVTDLDLWMYMKSSSLSKEIIIVDIKNKRSPQAFERMLWVKGLQRAVRADKAIVATSETKKEITEFGKSINVIVLDGTFMKKINSSISLNNRISEEEYDEDLKKSTMGKLDGDWRGRVSSCKSTLSGTLSFNTINYLLEQAKYFSEQVITRPILKTVALRSLYRIISYLCVGIDCVSKEIINEDIKNRYEFFKNGFTYGNQGATQINRSIERSINLIEQYGNVNGFNGNVVRRNIRDVFENLGTGMIAEYFSKQEVLAELMELALEFESASMSVIEPTTYGGSIRARSLLGCLLDFWQIDRMKFGLIKLEEQ